MDQKKYLQIQNQIQEAQNALKVWNDRRSEAMIELDAIFSELAEYKSSMELERQESQNTIQALKMELEKNEAEFHRHFKAYTNEMQEIKVRNEELFRNNKLLQKENEKLKNELNKRENDYQIRLDQIQSQSEIRISELQFQAKNELANVMSELQSSQNEKKVLVERSRQYEKELRGIRNQMMSFLNVTRDVSDEETTQDPVQGSLNEALASFESESDAELGSVALGSEPPKSVDEYLKRLGY